MTRPTSPERTSREQFDRQAAHYDVQWSRWTEESLEWMLAHADCRATDDALDVATGTGFTALGFAPHVRSVIGLDVSPGMLAQARQRAQAQGIANVTFQEGAAEAMPFADRRFDLVTCRIAAHHFLSIARFLSETRRVLQPGGRLLLADTSVPEDADADRWQNTVERLRDPSHVRNYTLHEWRRMLEAAELQIEALEDMQGAIPIALEDWLIKAGCTPQQSEQIRRCFTDAPQAARRAFRIETDAGGAIRFAWWRVAARAVVKS